MEGNIWNFVDTSILKMNICFWGTPSGVLFIYNSWTRTHHELFQTNGVSNLIQTGFDFVNKILFSLEIRLPPFWGFFIFVIINGHKYFWITCHCFIQCWLLCLINNSVILISNIRIWTKGWLFSVPIWLESGYKGTNNLTNMEKW